MAKAMVTLTFCDVCLTEKDLEIPAQPYDLGGYQVDACDEHSAPLVEAQKLAETYGSKGRRTPTISVARMTGSQAVGAESMPCPVPGCDSVLRGRQSLGAHVRQQHDMTLGEAEGKPIVATCDDCGAKFTTQNGHTLHIRQKHPEPAPKPRKRAARKGQRSPAEPAPESAAS